MAYQSLTATADWPATPQYTAAADTQMKIVNPNPSPVKWVTTNDDTKPALPPNDGDAIKPSEGEPIILLAGERLWLVAPNLRDGSAPVPVTLLY